MKTTTKTLSAVSIAAAFAYLPASAYTERTEATEVENTYVSQPGVDAQNPAERLADEIVDSFTEDERYGRNDRDVSDTHTVANTDKDSSKTTMSKPDSNYDQIEKTRSKTSDSLMKDSGEKSPSWENRKSVEQPLASESEPHSMLNSEKNMQKTAAWKNRHSVDEPLLNDKSHPQKSHAHQKTMTKRELSAEIDHSKHNHNNMISSISPKYLDEDMNRLDVVAIKKADYSERDTLVNSLEADLRRHEIMIDRSLTQAANKRSDQSMAAKLSKEIDQLQSAVAEDVDQLKSVSEDAWEATRNQFVESYEAFIDAVDNASNDDAYKYSSM